MDKTNYIPSVTIKNVRNMPFNTMLKALKPYVLEHVPEGILQDPDVYQEIERLIGRFSNIYSYMIYLYAYLANQVNKAKLAGDGELRDKMIRKRDAVYELARSVRYKHEACSRMLTAALGYDEGKVFERPDGKAREEKVEKRRVMKGWDSV